MTAVNLNALGDLSQVKQPVELKGTKTASTKEDFENVMKNKVANANGSDGLKVEKFVKPPAKRTEYRNDGVAKRDSLSEKDIKGPKKTASDPKTPDEILAGAAQILGIEPEELKAVLQSLEMDVGDLSDRNNVAQLILSLNGTDDISSMLVDNGMLEAFNELNGFMEEMLEANGMDADTFKAFVQNFNLNVKNENADQNVEEEITDEAAEETVPVLKESGPEITVTDNRESSESGMLSESEKPAEPIRNDFKEGQVATAVENFVQHLEMTEEVSETESATNFREIVFQVVEKIKVALNTDSTSLEMRLNPENLGRVSINITSKAGVMTAQINTENRQAKEAIESSLQILKENIEAKGIKVEAVEVRISDFNMADSRNSESQTESERSEGSKNSKRNSGLFANIADEADETVEETILNPESTVSFRA